MNVVFSSLKIYNDIFHWLLHSKHRHIVCDTCTILRKVYTTHDNRYKNAGLIHILINNKMQSTSQNFSCPMLKM